MSTKVYLLFFISTLIIHTSKCIFPFAKYEYDPPKCVREERFYPIDVEGPTLRLGFLVTRTKENLQSSDLLGLKIPGALAHAVDVVNKEGILPQGYKLQYKVIFIYFI